MKVGFVTNVTATLNDGSKTIISRNGNDSFSRVKISSTDPSSISTKVINAKEAKKEINSLFKHSRTDSIVLTRNDGSKSIISVDDKGQYQRGSIAPYGSIGASITPVTKKEAKSEVKEMIKTLDYTA